MHALLHGIHRHWLNQRKIDKNMQMLRNMLEEVEEVEVTWYEASRYAFFFYQQNDIVLELLIFFYFMSE